MRLRITLQAALAAIPFMASAQTPHPIPIEIVQKYFAEAQSLCQGDHGQLWAVSLCGPMMFVDPKSRYIVASQADPKGALKADDGVFAGFMPADRNIANTALEWSGVHWTQILWPLRPRNGRGTH